MAHSTCPEGDEFYGAQVFRAVWRDRWETDQPYPPLSQPAVPGRWNERGQPSIYTSHEPAVALHEKLQHVAPESWAGSLLAAAGLPIRVSIVVVGLEPIDVQTYDGRRDTDRDRLFPPLLQADYLPGQAFAASRRASGDLSLVVPSAPMFRETNRYRWNQVFFVGNQGQPGIDDLPKASDMWVECEAAMPEN